MRKACRWLWFVVLCASAQQPSQSHLPASLRLPDTQKLLYQLHGEGVQIYTCKLAEDKDYRWTLKAPDARLIGSDGQVFGRHFVGPTWEASDGSRIQGKVAATVPSPDAQSIAWLRLDVARHDGAGKLSAVTAIQRLNTEGGKSPGTGCDGAHVGAETRVPYEADYYFYGPAQ